MFDDLHDPNPPVPDRGDLAAVARRARDLRRRRYAAAATVCAVSLAAVGAAVAWRGGSDDRRLAPADGLDAVEPVGTSSSAPPAAAGEAPAPCLQPGVLAEPNDATATTTTSIERLEAAPTSTAGATTTATEPPRAAVAPTSTVLDPRTTMTTNVVEPPTSLPPMPSGTYAVTTVTVIGAGEPAPPAVMPCIPDTTNPQAGATTTSVETRPTVGITPTTSVEPAYEEIVITAIDGDGDALLLAANAVQGVRNSHLLLDGPDPDEPPEEGPIVHVDRVIATPDGTALFVSTCCEPSPGSVFVVDTVEPLTEPRQVFDGHALALSPSANRLAAVRVDDLVLAAVGEPTATQSLPFEADDAVRPIDVAWIDEGTLAVIGVSEETGISLYAISATDGRILASTLLAGGLDDVTTFRLAGIDGARDVAVFVTNALTASEIRTFDPVALSPRATIPLPGPALSASYREGRLLWVGENRQLRIDGGPPITGEYLWASW